MTPEQLDEIEKLAEAATGGKWQHRRWPCQIWEGDGPEAEMCAAIGPIYAKAEQPNREQVYADAKFMEAMSEHALPLVKALREARAEMDEFAIAVGYGERPEGQSGVHRIHGEQLAALWKQCDRERDEARAEVERLTHNLVQTERHAQLVEKSLADSQAEVERLRSALRLLDESP